MKAHAVHAAAARVHVRTAFENARRVDRVDRHVARRRAFDGIEALRRAKSRHGEENLKVGVVPRVPFVLPFGTVNHVLDHVDGHLFVLVLDTPVATPLYGGHPVRPLRHELNRG